jgi:hypothetical protein
MVGNACLANTANQLLCPFAEGRCQVQDPKETVAIGSFPVLSDFSGISYAVHSQSFIHDGLIAMAKN